MKAVRNAVAAIVVVYGVGIALALGAHEPWGYRWLLLAWSLYVFLTVAPVVPVAVAALCIAVVSAFRRRWQTAWAIVVICVVWIPTAFGSVRVGMAVCEHSWQRIVRNGTPVVAAVTRYEREHGRAPESLDALIPAYMERLPDTGVPCHPRYLIYREESGSPRWAVFVYVAHSIGHAPRVEYWPGGQYPASVGTETRGQGVWYFPIQGGWAYALPND